MPMTIVPVPVGLSVLLSFWLPVVPPSAMMKILAVGFLLSASVRFSSISSILLMLGSSGGLSTCALVSGCWDPGSACTAGDPGTFWLLFSVCLFGSLSFSAVSVLYVSSVRRLSSSSSPLCLVSSPASSISLCSVSSMVCATF